MKRSPTSPSSSSSSASSSSSSCVKHKLPVKKPIIKKPRKSNKKAEKCLNSPNSGRRSSIYRGVTRHRWTGRFEAHLWDKNSWNNIQSKRGKQVYLGAYDNEDAAAHTYDLAALKYWGPDTILNFPIDTYKKEVKEMNMVTKEEYLASLRRQSSGFSRGVSKYRGVARHHHNGRWEARIGRVFGNKYMYLGTFDSQEEAAGAYDMAALEYRGPNAVTNFDANIYIDRLKKKGILPYCLDQTTEQDNPCPNTSSIESPDQEEVVLETKVKQKSNDQDQDQEQQDQQQLVVDRNATKSYDHVPQSVTEEELEIVKESNELVWSFGMDEFNKFSDISDFSFDDSPGELSDLFDGTGFFDNIDSIFDVEYNNSNIDYYNYGMGNEMIVPMDCVLEKAMDCSLVDGPMECFEEKKMGFSIDEKRDEVVENGVNEVAPVECLSHKAMDCNFGDKGIEDVEFGLKNRTSDRFDDEVEVEVDSRFMSYGIRKEMWSSGFPWYVSSPSSSTTSISCNNIV